MGVFGDRLRQVVRRLRRSPMFTAITLVTLTVAVGANTVIFSVIEGVLLKPLPYAEPDRLVGLWHRAPGLAGMEHLNMAPFLYFIDREQSKTFEDVGMFTGDSLSVTGIGEPEHVRGLDVTQGVLPMLRVKPELGRLFTQEDDSASSPDTILISNAYWRQRFGGTKDVIGRIVTVDGKPRQVIGVLPRGFHFLDREDDAIVLPMKFDRNKTRLGNFSYQGMARMKPGVTLEQANADIGRLLPVAVHSFPAPDGFSAKVFETANLQPNLNPLKKDVVGDVGPVLWVLMGSIGGVLLIACANVANLLLVRVEGRRQELAVRTALGAGWRGIVGDLLLESAVLGLAGSVLGLGVAYGALRLLVAVAPTGLPRIHEIGIDVPVLFFTLGLALFTSFVIGSIPVWKYAGPHVNSALREGGRGLSQSREQHRARNGLVILQVALAMVLLICSGLMIRTFQALTHVPPGFRNPDELLTFRLYIPESRVSDKDPDQVLRLEREIDDRIAAVPGVTSVAFSSGMPMDGSDSNDLIYAQDRSYAEGDLPPVRRFRFVTPGLIGTVGTPLIAGRDLTWSEIEKRVPVVMISENMAREYWKDARSALGKRIRVASSDDWREVVGVVGDVYEDGVSSPAPKTVYWPALMSKFEGQPMRVSRGITLAVRSSRAGSQSFVKEVQQAVWSVDGDLPFADVHTLGYYYTKSMARTSFTLVMLCVAGSMALLLGVVGIYGVISYAVSQRTREIGIRMALGAQRQSITSMFVRSGLLLTGIGVACGLVTSLAAMRLMSSLLFQVSPVDPVTYGAMTAGIVVISYAACYLPSRRAATVNPVKALRAE